MGRHGAAGGKSSESPFEISAIIFSSVRFVVILVAVFSGAFMFFHFRKSATNTRGGNGRDELCHRYYRKWA